MTFGDALRDGTTVLKRHKCDPHAAREAEELLVFATGEAREALLAHPELRMTARQRKKFLDVVRRRTRHEPVEYIVGEADFFGRKFLVTKDTLIPRPATEILIEAVLESLKVKRSKGEKVIDVGTGSGAIAVTLALESPNAEIIATDTSAKALRIARANAKRHGVSSRIRFLKTDLLPAPDPRPQTSDLIVANLPYIPTADLKKLSPDVRLYEPRLALDGGRDGLEYYRRLVSLFTSSFSPSALFLEILPRQYRPLTKYAERSLPDCRTKKVTGPSGVTIGIHIEI